MVRPSAPRGAERFGRYLLLEVIGRGGMAEVYRSVAQGLEGFQRVFVIKRILKEKSSAPDFVQMFVNEARLSALLDHPNIVQIYDFGQIEGSYFLAMEYLRGKDLLALMRELRSRERQMGGPVAAYVAHEVALALHYAHQLRHGGKRMDIVHRDVSPSNIMLLRTGGVKLLDFGIAKADPEIRGDTQTTQAGFVKGKLSYVSPEQIRGQPVDARSDVFALGVVLWESLTGKRLFFDKSDFQTMKNVIERPVALPSSLQPGVPAALEKVVMRALERDANRRWQTAGAMADQLEGYLHDTRFATRELTRLLDELFMRDSPHIDSVPIAAPDPSRVTKPMRIDLELSAAMSVPLPPLTTDDEETYTGVSSVYRAEAFRATRRSWMAVAAGMVLAIGGTAAVMRSGHHAGIPKAGVGAPSVPEVVEPLPEAVTIQIESDPMGAEVHADDGEMLGVTPTVLTIPRSEHAISLTVSKVGYVSRSHTVVPVRDVTALFGLRPQDPPPKRWRGPARQ